MINLLDRLEAYMAEIPPAHNRERALTLCRELRGMDCGHYTDIDVPEGDPIRIYDTLQEVGRQLSPDFGTRRTRANCIIKALGILLPDIIKV